MPKKYSGNKLSGTRYNRVSRSAVSDLYHESQHGIVVDMPVAPSNWMAQISAGIEHYVPEAVFWPQEIGEMALTLLGIRETAQVAHRQRLIGGLSTSELVEKLKELLPEQVKAELELEVTDVCILPRGEFDRSVALWVRSDDSDGSKAQLARRVDKKLQGPYRWRGNHPLVIGRLPGEQAAARDDEIKKVINETGPKSILVGKARVFDVELNSGSNVREQLEQYRV